MHFSEFEIAKELAVKAGAFLKDQKDRIIESLEGKDIKLELDRRTESLLIRELASHFDYPILSEESGEIGNIKSGQPYWIIDPIDGTMNYSRNCPLSCVSIALWKNNDPILGVVYDFNREELFSGLVGVGAWMNESKIVKSLGVVKSQAILATGFPTYLTLDDNYLIGFIDEVKDYKKVRMFGTAALSLCYVACGRVDAYKEQNIKLWDVAAGIAINMAIEVKTEIKIEENYNTTTSVGII